MRVILDECLPRPLAALLTGHEVKTVRRMRWNGKENGELLKLIARHFDVFITVDKSIPAEQNLRKSKLAILILRAPTNKLDDVVPLLSDILVALRNVRPGQVLQIPRSG